MDEIVPILPPRGHIFNKKKKPNMVKHFMKGYCWKVQKHCLQ